MHFAFDTWMARNFPGCPFERYADLSRHRDKSAYAEFLIMPRIALDGSKTAENGCKSSA
jgi:hypothetical protein